MQTISNTAIRNTHLQERHFVAALLVALAIHLLVLLIWMLAPKTPVVEIPVRILNIKLGQQDESLDIVGSLQPAPAIKNPKVFEKEVSRVRERERLFVQAKPEAVAHAPSQPVKPREAIKPAPAPQAEKQQLAQAEPLQAKALPVQLQQPHQYVRPQPYDYRPLGETEQPENSGEVLGNSTASEAELFQRYGQLLSAWLLKFKTYPAQAHDAGIQGKAIVRIRIDRMGNIRFVSLDQSTGSQILDQSVLQMIHDANPLPPSPPDYRPNDDLLEFKIPISYTLQ